MAPKSTEVISTKLTFIEDIDAGAYDLDDLLRSEAEELGRDAFGTTYRAEMASGKAVVVKRLKDTCLSHEEFNRKIQEIVKLTSHKSLHPLRAYYFSRDEKLLLFDYMPMGSLASLLHRNGKTNKAALTWKVRGGIAFEVACGIAHLHSQGSNICHGNIRSSNVLLSNFFDAHLSEFGIAQLCTPNVKHDVSSGYHAPEVESIENFTQKADVYSFGVVLLELLTGKAPMDAHPKTKGIELASWVRSMFQEKPIIDVFDNMLQNYQNFGGQMVQLLQLAICCTFQNPDRRPSMTAVTNRIKEICRF